MSKKWTGLEGLASSLYCCMYLFVLLVRVYERFQAVSCGLDWAGRVRL